ncbi:esterase family protein, partial [Rhodococcus erythropolis]|nr:esterase family protein [Rhodococcus erythropolis]
GTNQCTQRLAERLDSLGIPATYDFRATGTHSWGYWQDDLHNSWSMIAESIGAR